MNYFLWLLRILLFLVLLGFAFKNTEPVTVRFYLGAEWESPLAFVLLAAFVLGAVAGLLASLGMVFRKRREAVKLRKQLRARDTEHSA